MERQHYTIQNVLRAWAMALILLVPVVGYAFDHDETTMWVLGSYSSETSAERVADELESLTGQLTALQEIQRSGLTLFRVLMDPGTDADQPRLIEILEGAGFERPWRLSVEKSSLIGQFPRPQTDEMPSAVAVSEQNIEAMAETSKNIDYESAEAIEASQPVEQTSRASVSDRLSPDSEYHPIRLYPRN